MNLIQRLLGRPSPEVRRLIEEIDESSEELRRRIEEDPCAADPNRRECGPDIHDVLMGRRQERPEWRS